MKPERTFKTLKSKCYNDFKMAQSSHLNPSPSTLLINARTKLNLNHLTFDAAVSIIKKEEGIAQFIRNGVAVNERIAVYLEDRLSEHLAIRLAEKVQTHGFVFFVGKSAEEESVGSAMEANSLSQIYSIIEEDTVAKRGLAAFLLEAKVTLLLTSSTLLEDHLDVFTALPTKAMILL